MIELTLVVALLLLVGCRQPDQLAPQVVCSLTPYIYCPPEADGDGDA